MLVIDVLVKVSVETEVVVVVVVVVFVVEVAIFDVVIGDIKEALKKIKLILFFY